MIIESGYKGSGPKEKKKEHYPVTQTKKKRIVLRMMVIKPMILRSFCFRRSNDVDGKMEFQGLLNSCQMVQSVETKGSDGRRGEGEQK
ncbi:hypothetical protein AVEN_59288-1 [Araneus ventricosus]|uniref:Uncharacterized protein n=1 Tax=Araneus ventricosus TaxID=182803 RepID=A0A4Y2L301_ARAVE|nr:hypothetical protein AVEN_59288-1 [Araneus ventricosus]